MGPTHITINHDYLKHNLQVLKKAIKKVKILAIVKANAYGHGSIEVSRSLEEEGVDFFGVAYVEEGIALRNAGIKSPILVLLTQLPESFKKHVDYNFGITISYFDQLKQLEEFCKKEKKTANIHFKVDTGMNRTGFFYEDIYPALDYAMSGKWINVEGIYSHLSSSDEENPDYTMMQIRRFKEVRDKVKSSYSKDIIFHLANSAGVVKYPESWFDMVRPGTMLYGNPPDPNKELNWNLKEVLTLKSRVAFIKELAANAPVSYNRRYYTKEKTRIAVIPVGYADGYNRLLTNNANVLIGGQMYPLIGAVCMDQIIINLGYDSPVNVNDEVVLIGKQFDQFISISDIARRVKSLPYEVTCRLSARVERIHQYNG